MPAQDMHQFTSVFRTDSHRVKRNRAALSCISCQRRKSKCDREQPCGACEKRGTASTCRFGTQGPPVASAGRHDLQNRLNQLEEMVKSLAEAPAAVYEQPSSPITSPDSGTTSRQTPTDQTQTDGAEVAYHGPTSWTAIVDSIHNIRNSLEDYSEAETDYTPVSMGLDVLLREADAASTADLLDSLPPRPEMDRLVQAYFNSKFVSSIFLHVQHFQRRYESFLVDPRSMNLLWVSILYSVLCIGAMIVRTKTPAGVSPGDVAEPVVYMAKASQCLVAGEYLKAKTYSVEAILLHAQSRNVLQKDFDPAIWCLFGLASRLAQRRGYHRSATKLSSKVSPFEAEMRRRIWNATCAADLMYSSQLGMPMIVHEGFFDVEPPTNLADEDFNEDTRDALPPPRPPLDPTPILAYIVKGQMCKVLRRIMHYAMTVVLPPFSEAVILDAQLAEVYASIPACLRNRPIRSSSFTDASHTIMHRIMLQMVYLKSLCMLHRPYLTSNKSDPQHKVFRESCRNAALGMLDLHIEIERETQKGGRLYEDRYMVTSLALHDFLIAAMVICLDLCESTDISVEERRARGKTLSTIHQIWRAKSYESMDAQHASKVLGAILKKTASFLPPLSSPNSSGRDTHAEPEKDNAVSLPKETASNAFDVFMGGNDEMLDWFSIDEFLRQDQPEAEDLQYWGSIG